MIVREHINFKRGLDPKEAMGVGRRGNLYYKIRNYENAGNIQWKASKYFSDYLIPFEPEGYLEDIEMLIDDKVILKNFLDIDLGICCWMNKVAIVELMLRKKCTHVKKHDVEQAIRGGASKKIFDLLEKYVNKDTNWWKKYQKLRPYLNQTNWYIK